MLTAKTRAALAKYGRETCVRAAKLSAEGNGASTIGVYLGLRTNQADAAINAGQELVAQPRQYRAAWDAGYGYTGGQLLSGTWASEADALRYARVMVGPQVTHVEAVEE